MVVNDGERMEAADSDDIESMHRHIADFLGEQVLAGADPDVLTDLGYPEIDDEVDFEIRARGNKPADAESDSAAEIAETDTQEPVESAAQPTGKPEVKYRKQRKSRRPRDLAAGDLRPDLKPFPYGTRED